jgi:hypothetical protein
MGPVSGRLTLTVETKVGLVHERGGLQAVARALAAQVHGGAPPQLAVQQFQRSIASVEIACGPGAEELGDLVPRISHNGFRVGRFCGPRLSASSGDGEPCAASPSMT